MIQHVTRGDGEVSTNQRCCSDHIEPPPLQFDDDTEGEFGYRIVGSVVLKRWQGNRREIVNYWHRHHSLSAICYANPMRISDPLSFSTAICCVSRGCAQPTASRISAHSGKPGKVAVKCSLRL